MFFICGKSPPQTGPGCRGPEYWAQGIRYFPDIPDSGVMMTQEWERGTVSSLSRRVAIKGCHCRFSWGVSQASGLPMKGTNRWLHASVSEHPTLGIRTALFAQLQASWKPVTFNQYHSWKEKAMHPTGSEGNLGPETGHMGGVPPRVSMAPWQAGRGGQVFCGESEVDKGAYCPQINLI